jgi:hypothetical protein
MKRMLWMLAGLLLIGGVGCSTTPSDRPWNRPSKAEIAQPWVRVGNPEVDLHRAENPLP